MDIPIGLFARILNPIITPISEFFFSRPKIYVEFVDRGSSSHLVQGTSSYHYSWRHELKLINNSNHDAYNIVVDETLSNSFDRIEKLGQFNNLEKRKHLILKTSTERVLESETGLGMRTGAISGLFPPGHEEFILVIKYSNEKGRTFYTLYKFKDYAGVNELFYKNPLKK